MGFHVFTTKSVTSWHKLALVITVTLLVFSLVFIGTKGLSRGAAIMSLVAAGWVVFGLLTGQARFPKPLILPILFYLMIAISGLFLPVYPFDYLGNVTTVWVGAICIAFFIANGIAVEIVIGVFVLNFLLNMGAIVFGYDAYFVNQGFDAGSLQDSEIKRYSGIAGQPNIMIALVLTMPFLFFLLKEKVSVLVYVLLVCALIAITIVSGSRSGIGFTLYFIIVGALFLIKGLKFKIIAVVSATLFVIVAWGSINNQDQLLLKLENSSFSELVVVQRLIEGLDDATGVNAVDDTRKEMRTQFWKYFYQKPVFGFGPNQFRYVFEGEKSSMHTTIWER